MYVAIISLGVLTAPMPVMMLEVIIISIDAMGKNARDIHGAHDVFGMHGIYVVHGVHVLHGHGAHGISRVHCVDSSHGFDREVRGELRLFAKTSSLFSNLSVANHYLSCSAHTSLPIFCVMCPCPCLCFIHLFKLFFCFQPSFRVTANCVMVGQSGQAHNHQAAV